MSPPSHMKYMLLGGAAAFVIALLVGVPAQSALFVGALVACPLMMVFMMAGHGQEHGQEHEGSSARDPKNRENQGQDGHITPTHPM